MSRQLKRSGHLLAALGVLLLATACSSQGSSSPQADVGSSATPTPTPSASPTENPPSPTPPPVRACYRLSYDDAVAPTSDKQPSPCTGPHTALTFFVGSLGTDASGHTFAVDSPQAHRQVSTECPRRFATFAGGTIEARRLSMLRTIWFTPTIEQAAAGAHWFRCEAIAVADSEHLARLTGILQGVFSRADGRARYSLCATAEPGTTGFEPRICTLPHTWRALSTVPFRPGTYPGLDTVKSAGETPCKDAARAVASDPLNFQWSYQWPTLAQWRSGQTYGVCWAPGT
jgi:hypothetical protein